MILPAEGEAGAFLQQFLAVQAADASHAASA